jgi:hypothetical protein
MERGRGGKESEREGRERRAEPSAEDGEGADGGQNPVRGAVVVGGDVVAVVVASFPFPFSLSFLPSNSSFFLRRPQKFMNSVGEGEGEEGNKSSVRRILLPLSLPRVSSAWSRGIERKRETREEESVVDGKGRVE